MEAKRGEAAVRVEAVEAVPAGDADRERRSKSSEDRSRLVVELSSTTAEMLNELCDIERLNKTTVVNRAIQVYHLLRMAQASGGQVQMSDSKDGELQRVHFI
jgi:hypothetical protein